MALSPAEKQKQYRERKREAERKAVDPTDRITKRPFNAFIQEDEDAYNVNVLHPLEWAGINPDAAPTFEIDDDPGYQDEDGEPYRGSIGQAERMIVMLMDAGRGLAYLVRDYKLQEIDRAIAELERADLSDAAVKKRALADIVRLNKYRDQLSRDIRWTLPQWKVKGG